MLAGAAAADEVAEAVRAAAPDATTAVATPVTPADAAVDVADAVDAGNPVVALTLPDALADPTVQRTVRAAVDAGVIVVGPLPVSGDVPDDLPVVLVGDPGQDPRAVSAGTEDPAGTALVAGTAALLAGQVTPAEVGELLTNTARGPERTVDASAAVDLAANLAAGGSALPPSEDLGGGIRPGAIGALAFGLALVTIVTTILYATRGPKSTVEDG